METPHRPRYPRWLRPGPSPPPVFKRPY
jgi:hypothetical protein